jgi:hypothetical protein
MTRVNFARVLMLAALGAATAAPAAQVSVGGGSSLDLGSGSLDLGCGDLSIAGSLSAGSVGLEGLRDVSIDPSGLMNGDSAELEVARDWDNAGAFNAGTSSVRFVDGCGASSAVVSGDTTFATLDLSTSTGKLYSFVSGSTQTVTGSLHLGGAAGNLLTIRSTLGGSEAFLDAQGSVSAADYVDVDDNHATGNPIPLGPNSVTGANTTGWMALALPMLSPLGLGALALALGWGGSRGLRARLGRREGL